MKTKRFLVALLAGALLLAACGDDDDSGSSGESNEYVEALAASITSDEDAPFSDSQAQCLAGEFVSALGGPEALEAQGITPADLEASEDMSDLGLEATDEQAEELAGAFTSCDISLKELILEQAGDDIPDEVKDCVADALDEDALAEFFAATLTDPETEGDDLPPEILEGMFSCFEG